MLHYNIKELSSYNICFYTEIQDTRLRESKSLLEKALKRGFVKCRTVVCLLVGVAGAGKTHTKHLLFRWAPPEVRNSTPLAARPVQAIRVSTQDGQLQEVDPDQLDQIIASTVANRGGPLERKSFFPNLFCCKCNQTTSAEICPPSVNPYLSGTAESPASEFNKRKCCFCCQSAHYHGSDIVQITKAALDKTIHQIANTPRGETQPNLDSDWIYLIDSGGQVEFLEVLPAFLQHTSICLFVTKLSEMLSERPKIEYFENGKPVGEPMLCPFTNEQMLMRCVQTIQTQCINQASSTNKGSKRSKPGLKTSHGRNPPRSCRPVLRKHTSKKSTASKHALSRFCKKLGFSQPRNYVSHQCKEPRLSRS